MSTIFIKAYCDNIVVNIKPIYLNIHSSLCVSLQLERKNVIFHCEENVHRK